MVGQHWGLGLHGHIPSCPYNHLPLFALQPSTAPCPFPCHLEAHLAVLKQARCPPPTYNPLHDSPGPLSLLPTQHSTACPPLLLGLAKATIPESAPWLVCRADWDCQPGTSRDHASNASIIQCLPHLVIPQIICPECPKRAPRGTSKTAPLPLFSGHSPWVLQEVRRTLLLPALRQLISLLSLSNPVVSLTR